MAHLYFSAKIDSNRSICLSVLSDKMLEFVTEDDLDPSCYYLYEIFGANGVRSVEILASVPSDEAAMRLSSMMGLS